MGKRGTKPGAKPSVDALRLAQSRIDAKTKKKSLRQAHNKTYAERKAGAWCFWGFLFVSVSHIMHYVFLLSPEIRVLCLKTCHLV